MRINVLFFAQCLVLFLVSLASAASITDSEKRTLVFSQPFKRIISLYPAHTTNLLELGLNKEIIAIDQVPLGKAAERKVNQADHQIYVRPLANGSHAVAILNCGDKDKSIQADFKQLGLNGKYLIRDVWQHRDIAKKTNRWKGTVKAHETKVFVLK